MSSALKTQQYAAYPLLQILSSQPGVTESMQAHSGCVLQASGRVCTQDRAASESQGVGRWRSHLLPACTHFPGLARQMTRPANVSPGVNVFPFKHLQSMWEEIHFDLMIFWIMQSMQTQPMTDCFTFTARVYFEADNELSHKCTGQSKFLSFFVVVFVVVSKQICSNVSKKHLV